MENVLWGIVGTSALLLFAAAVIAASTAIAWNSQAMFNYTAKRWYRVSGWLFAVAMVGFVVSIWLAVSL